MQKKSHTFNNEFSKYLDCKMNLCPYCRGNHTNANIEHKIIDYDKVNFICPKHYVNYISYCNQCKINICRQCENEHLNHDKVVFESILKASDSIFILKEIIFKNLSIPFNKIKITNSNKIIEDDSQLPNLNFEIEIYNVYKIKINVINGNNTETTFVDPYSYIDDIYTKLNKNYKFDLKFNGKKYILVDLYANL